MNVIKGVLFEEKQRSIEMQKSYINEINALPKGSVSIKKIGNKQYCYLKYRNGDKFISQYVGSYENNFEQIKKQVEKRKYFEKLLSELKAEYKMISKVVKD